METSETYTENNVAYRASCNKLQRRQQGGRDRTLHWDSANGNSYTDVQFVGPSGACLQNRGVE